jgi:hypothetical protein
MAFEQGHKKQGGRAKGVPNRLTKEMRSVLKDIVYNELENIQDTLESLTPKERLDIILKLIPYIVPKVKTVSHTINEPFEFDLGF